MKTAREYISENPDYDIHIVDKKIGKGDLLIKLFYREQIRQFKQGFVAYVDSNNWEDDRYSVMLYF